LSIACLHLGLAADERARHVRIILERLSGQSHIALAGDFNEGPGSDSWKALAALANDPKPDAAPTFPSWKQTHRIDAILVSGDVRVLNYDTWRPDDRDLQLSSDHRPVLAVLSTS
jgi:endonuclease/exonuclease/phosphatase family metal-dependent hydrolase